MLPRMTTLTIDEVRSLARLAGLDGSGEELEALRPGLERLHEGLARLEALDCAGLEPATTYRML